MITELILASLALGMLLLTIPAVALQARQQRHLQPLLGVLLALLLIGTGPLIFTLWPAGVFGYIALLPLAFFALTPSLRFYTTALTAISPWHWQPGDARSFWPLGFALVLAVLILTLPEPALQQLFFGDSTHETAEIHGQSLLVAMLFLVAVLGWLAQSCYDLCCIVRTVHRYRQQLRQVFAEDAGKRLSWLLLFCGCLLFSWCYALAVLWFAEPVPSPWLSDAIVLGCLLALVWLLAWGSLQQKPGFSEVVAEAIADVEEPAVKLQHDADSTLDDGVGNDKGRGLGGGPDQDSGKNVAEGPPQESCKYQRSALSDSQALRIADKLHCAIYEQALYLDSGLTLYKLAAQLGVPAQYLSQTLNQTLRQSFFDYINQARVEAAKVQLLQTDASVLTIAMAVGFNARSSFYKAFKTVTGVTPAEFRMAATKSRSRQSC